jgi:hypothetical protein
MKSILTIICAVILLQNISLSQDKAKAKENAVGYIDKIIKEILYSRNGKDWEKQTKKGQALTPSNEIKTEKDCFAIVKFTDNSVLRIRENSYLKIYADAAGEGRNKGIKKNAYIDKGSAGFKVEKQKNNNEFKFTTPTMVASIRGTEGLVKIESDTLSILAVEKGLVFVEGSGGKKQNGNVPGGSYAQVNASGEVLIKDIDQNIQKEIDKAKEIKQLIIKTDKGDLIIDYK